MKLRRYGPNAGKSSPVPFLRELRRAWEEAEIAYRFGLATYRIKIRNPAHVSRGIGSVVLDGVAIPDGNVPLTDDGQEHEVIVELRETAENEKKVAR